MAWGHTGSVPTGVPAVYQQMRGPIRTCLWGAGSCWRKPGQPEGRQGGYDHQTALVALRTALNVDAREATHHRRGGFPRQHGGRGLRQQAAACRQLGSPTAIAYHPVMANAQKPGG